MLLDFFSALLFWLLFIGVILVFVFAAIGIESVYKDYKKSKWEKKYGAKLKERTERNRWESLEQLRDKIFVLEQAIKDTNANIDIQKIDMVIDNIDYDTRYEKWKNYESKWELYFFYLPLTGTSEKAQADVDEDFEKYESHREQELRAKLREIT